MALPVLIVEDDDALREALSDTLELGGFEVVTASDGAAALVKLAHTGLAWCCPMCRCSPWMAKPCWSKSNAIIRGCP